MLDCDGSGKGVEILEELSDPDLVPGVPVLLPERVVRGEAVEDGGPALSRHAGEQLGLGRASSVVVAATVSGSGRAEKELPLEDGGSGLPEGGGDGGVVHARPQTEGLADVRLQWIGEGGAHRDRGWRLLCLLLLHYLSTLALWWRRRRGGEE